MQDGVVDYCSKCGLLGTLHNGLCSPCLYDDDDNPVVKHCELCGRNRVHDEYHDGLCRPCYLISHGHRYPRRNPGEMSSLIARSDDGNTKIVYRHSERLYLVYTEGVYIGHNENRIAAYFMAGIPLPSDGW